MCSFYEHCKNIHLPVLFNPEEGNKAPSECQHLSRKYRDFNLNLCFGAQNNCLIEMVLLSTLS